MYILWFETDDTQDTATSMVLKRLHHSKKYVDAWDTYVQNRRRSVPTGDQQVGSRPACRHWQSFKLNCKRHRCEPSASRIMKGLSCRGRLNPFGRSTITSR